MTWEEQKFGIYITGSYRYIWSSLKCQYICITPHEENFQVVIMTFKLIFVEDRNTALSPWKDTLTKGHSESSWHTLKKFHYISLSFSHPYHVYFLKKHFCLDIFRNIFMGKKKKVNCTVHNPEKRNKRRKFSAVTRTQKSGKKKKDSSFRKVKTGKSYNN